MFVCSLLQLIIPVVQASIDLFDAADESRFFRLLMLWFSSSADSTPEITVAECNVADSTGGHLQ